MGTDSCVPTIELLFQAGDTGICPQLTVLLRQILAERQGFEPWVPLRALLLSKQVRSTTTRPLRFVLYSLISKSSYALSLDSLGSTMLTTGRSLGTPLTSFASQAGALNHYATSPICHDLPARELSRTPTAAHLSQRRISLKLKRVRFWRKIDKLLYKKTRRSDGSEHRVKYHPLERVLLRQAPLDPSTNSGSSRVKSRNDKLGTSQDGERSRTTTPLPNLPQQYRKVFYTFL